MNRDLWQVNGIVYFQDDGSLATKEIADEFLKKHALIKEQEEVTSKLRDKEIEDFLAKWGPKVDEYYGDPKFSKDFPKVDEEELLYWMATAIFDKDGKVTEEMKRLFPEFWEEALAMYERGEHDT